MSRPNPNVAMNQKPTIAVAWPKDDYVTSVEVAGGTPRIVSPSTDPAPDLLDGCDGLLLTGGADVDPVHYGDDERHPTLSLETERDEYELALARRAMERDMPVLAICRGVQLLNVAAGGTLYQDLPSQFPSAIDHRIKEPANQPSHAVKIAPHSKLARFVGGHADEVQVNSRHHQAVRQVAPGFVAVAHADDGVVEGIERPDSTFCMGVQWHPENFWQTGDFSTLFEGFVQAARDYSRRRSG
jgi:putative glutamine amidotransferase